MADAIDIVDFVHGVAVRKRGRACVVMTHEYSGQREWAGRLASRTGSQHVDLLDLFHEEERLADNLATYTPKGLFTLLQERVKQDTAVVSGIEFLKASWSGRPNGAEEFATQLETWQGDPALVFVMQYDNKICGKRS